MRRPIGIEYYDADRKPELDAFKFRYYNPDVPTIDQKSVIEAYHRFFDSPQFPGTPDAVLTAAATYFNGAKAGTIIPKHITSGSWSSSGMRSWDSTEGREIVARFLSAPLDPENPEGTSSSTYDALLAHITFIKAKWGVA